MCVCIMHTCSILSSVLVMILSTRFLWFPKECVRLTNLLVTFVARSADLLQPCLSPTGLPLLNMEV